MMRMKTIVEEPSPENRSSGGGAENEWEMRPGGMLVQKRNPDSDQNRLPPPPTIRVRVKYGSMYHEINISSQATFGELKKMLSGPTGVHHEDQKLLFKDKERDSKTFLDVVGVKDKSKIVLVEDLISQEKRILETRKIAKMEKSAKIISEISFEVDRLAGQVSAYESVISKGGKVGEKQVVNLIELLMNQLLKLDGIIADGDVKLQRKMQVQRVQKCVETLDVLKLKNSTSSSNGTHISPKPKQQPSNLLDILTLKKSIPSSNGTHISPKPQQQQQQSSSLSDMLNVKKSVPPSSHRTHISPKPQQQQQSSSLLDMLSVTKSVPSSNGTHISPKLKQQQQSPIQKNEQRYSAENNSTQAQYPQSRRTIGHVPIILQQEQQTARNSVPIILQQEQQTARNSAGGSVVITTQWETFDPIPAPKPVPPTTSKHPQFTWDLL